MTANTIPPHANDVEYVVHGLRALRERVVARASLVVAPERIGPYRVLRELGSGGMATVWLAEQHDPVRRRVAIKLIRPGRDDRQVLARFEAERQLLALMEHECIARILDAGVTQSGEPWLAMEYIEGMTITNYCDRQRLGVRDRVELLAAVCAGVQHAHYKGIIHRDLKPANVLVATIDGRAVPKVIDFGVARVFGTQVPGCTKAGEIVGTPSYMSPEQARGGPIDTRSDVYALGLLLFELLTGALPFDGAADHGAIAPLPSARLAALGSAARDAAARRDATVRGLMRQLGGDVDTIAAKALDPDPERRYMTARELGDDLLRYLRGERVHARPASLLYRLRVLARRYPRGAVAAAILVPLLFVTSMGMGVFAWRSYQSACLARSLLATSEFLEDFTELMLWQGRGGHSEALEPEQILALSPHLREPLEEALAGRATGQTLRAMGHFATARPLLQRAVEVTTAELGEGHPAAIASMTELALLLHQEGSWDEAEPWLRRSLALARGALGATSHAALRAQRLLGALLDDLGRSKEAEVLLHEVVRVRAGDEAEAGSHSMAAALESFGMHAVRTGRLDEAEGCLQRALAIRRGLVGSSHPLALTAEYQVGLLHKARREFATAKAVLGNVLQRQSWAMGLRHPEKIRTQIELAACLRELGDLRKARGLLESILDVPRELLDESHPLRNLARQEYALVLEARGERARAVARLAEVVELNRKLGRTDPQARRAATDLERVAATLPE